MRDLIQKLSWSMRATTMLIPDKKFRLQPGGKELWLRPTEDRKWVQFTILGPRLGMLAVDFVTPRRLRGIGRN